MIKYTSILILSILLIFSACNKDDNDSPSDPLYPTTIERLNSIDYQNKLTAFKSKNPYLQSDINQFGFSDVTENYTDLPASSKQQVYYTAGSLYNYQEFYWPE